MRLGGSEPDRSEEGLGAGRGGQGAGPRALGGREGAQGVVTGPKPEGGRVFRGGTWARPRAGGGA